MLTEWNQIEDNPKAKTHHLIFNKLHHNKVKYWTWISDIFAFTLVFFALSGLFLVKGPKGIKGRGKWYLIAGIVIPLLFLLWM